MVVPAAVLSAFEMQLPGAGVPTPSQAWARQSLSSQSVRPSLSLSWLSLQAVSCAHCGRVESG